MEPCKFTFCGRTPGIHSDECPNNPDNAPPDAPDAHELVRMIEETNRRIDDLLEANGLWNGR